MANRFEPIFERTGRPLPLQSVDQQIRAVFEGFVYRSKVRDHIPFDSTDSGITNIENQLGCTLDMVQNMGDL